MVQDSLIVVALGGNAISRENEEGNVNQQFANSRRTAVALADLIFSGHRLVITHGNGPQIGNFLVRNEAAAGVIYALPMEVAVAHVQGGMGFMIGQTLTNELARRGRKDIVTTIVTTILLDAEDPSFKNPTKPIGRVMDQADAQRFGWNEGWSMKEVSPGKFRRVVPSPMPRQIMELSTISRCVEAGDIIITCGGGGIPVIRDREHGLRGTAAVIDKDLASALLARELRAKTLMILTAVDRVAINFGKPGQRELERMTVVEARRWMAEGQFPAGSMGPKVQAAIEFVEHSSNEKAEAVIGPLDHAADALAGKIGTRMTRT
ncbi:MAG: carbamate kinase [Planctomycetes bacterium]|nr:carbamate kinase [Planctomycetota bacterium]MBI3833576.1 carbamate kinase [Planctomycetota bacterium]